MKLPDMFHPKLREDDGVFYFRYYRKEYAFHENAIVVSEPGTDDEPECDVYKMIYNNKDIGLVGPIENGVQYGSDTVSIDMVLQRDGALKETVTLKEPTDISMTITGVANQKDVDRKTITPNRAIAYLKANNKHEISVGGKYPMVFCEPDNGVKLSVDGGILDYVLPKGVKYPFTFDPTIEGNTANPTLMKKGIKRTSTGRLYVAGIDSANDVNLYYSDDLGASWTALDSGYNGVLNFVSLCIDSSDNAYFIFQDSDNSHYLRVVKYDGSFTSAQNTGVTGAQPDIDIGPNDAWQCVYHRVNTYFRVYHYDKVNGESQVSKTTGDRSIHASIYVDSSNTAHMAYGQGESGVQNKSLYYAKKTYGGSVSGRVSLDNSGTTLNDIRVPQIIKLGSTYYIAYVNWRVPQAGIGNVRIVSSTDGVTWSAPLNITNDGATYEHSLPFLGADDDGNLWIFWIGKGRGSYPLQFQICYRKMDSGGTWTPALGNAPNLLTDTNTDKRTQGIMDPGTNNDIPAEGMCYAYQDLTNLDLLFDDTLIVNWDGGGGLLNANKVIMVI